MMASEQAKRDEAKRVSLLRASQYAYEQEQQIAKEMVGYDWDNVHGILTQAKGTMSLERAKELSLFIKGAK